MPANWRIRQRAFSRLRHINKAMNTPALRPRFTQARFLLALQGSCGIKQVIAKRLNCTRTQIDHALEHPNWEKVKAAFLYEVESTTDVAKRSIINAMRQSGLNPQVGTLNARWYLSKMDREKFGEEMAIKHKGDRNNPLTLQHDVISLETLDLPIEVKRQVMDAIDKRDQAHVEQRPQ